MRRWFRNRIRQWVVRLGVLLAEAGRQIERETLPAFANRPDNLRIEMPRRIVNPEYMTIGDDVWLGPGSLLVAVREYPTAPMRHPGQDVVRQTFSPRIVIGHRVSSTAGLQIAAMSEIVVEDDVLFASNINITDALHGYDNVDEPYKVQSMTRVAPIRVGRGCWIGQNVVILPGVTIGEMSIIGANSVVANSVPARSIAVGNPARVVKRWDEMAQAWQEVAAADRHEESVEVSQPEMT